MQYVHVFSYSTMFVLLKGITTINNNEYKHDVPECKIPIQIGLLF